MNANEPAMTKISPMNAGMLVLVEIESWGLVLVSVSCLLYKPIFSFNFTGVAPREKKC